MTDVTLRMKGWVQRCENEELNSVINSFGGVDELLRCVEANGGDVELEA